MYQVLGGPMVRIKLCAEVTMPDMQISDDVLDFSEVKCGECKVVTVQLYNQQMVRCEWSAHCSDRRQVREGQAWSQPSSLMTLTLTRNFACGYMEIESLGLMFYLNVSRVM